MYGGSFRVRGGKGKKISAKDFEADSSSMREHSPVPKTQSRNTEALFATLMTGGRSHRSDLIVSHRTARLPTISMPNE